jgi:methionyl aminopeptidase
MSSLQKSPDEIVLIRTAATILSETLRVLRLATVPGISGAKLDRLAQDTIIKLGGEPGFLGFQDYPATICLSINEAVVHGIPTDAKLESGDVVSIDVGVRYDGWNADAAITVLLTPIDPEDQKLLNAATTSLDAGIAKVKAGAYLGDVQAAIQKVIDDSKFGNVRSMTGHGIGKELHEAPAIPNYGKAGTGLILEEGMVICLEPMLTRGNGKVVTAQDGWTIITADQTRAAHVEHTILVTTTGADVLTRQD